jgi:hypothetical protein
LYILYKDGEFGNLNVTTCVIFDILDSVVSTYKRVVRKGLKKLSTEHGPIYTKMLPALQSKKNEFHLYGYTTVTVEDIWIYCVRKLWRKKDVSKMRSYQITNDILQILPAAFMTYTQIEAQRNSDWFSDMNSEDLQILLNPNKDVENGE